MAKIPFLELGDTGTFLFYRDAAITETSSERVQRCGGGYLSDLVDVWEKRAVTSMETRVHKGVAQVAASVSAGARPARSALTDIHPHASMHT